MPLIVVKMKEGRDQEQKAALIEGLTNEFVRLTSMNPNKVQVIIEEVKQGDWGVGGKLI